MFTTPLRDIPCRPKTKKKVTMPCGYLSSNHLHPLRPLNKTKNKTKKQTHTPLHTHTPTKTQANKQKQNKNIKKKRKKKEKKPAGTPLGGVR